MHEFVYHASASIAGSFSFVSEQCRQRSSGIVSGPSGTNQAATNRLAKPLYQLLTAALGNFKKY
jgi:hypothetical protein